jgi:uncharacterized damage-inducible protein DinB
MNTLEHLRHLFNFNDRANIELVGALKKDRSERALRLLSHLLITEKEYFERLKGKDSTGFDFWPELSVQECEDTERENTKAYSGLLSDLEEDGLDSAVNYRTSQGAPYENTIREMLTHVLFHSMTHRGQALAALRADGFEPPKIDYIIFSRED